MDYIKAFGTGMTMDIKKPMLMVSLIIMLLAGCAGNQDHSMSAENEQNSQNCGPFYSTVVYYSGESESTEKYLEIAARSERLFLLLEENADAFVMDAYNYKDLDGKGTLLYTMNELSYPVEIAPNGQSIRVSKNYFQYNPIETVDGSDIIDQIIYDDLTLNILVPEKYQNIEAQIIEAYRDTFYFEKVQAENDYNEMADNGNVLDIPLETLNVHIIYVKDEQRYFTFSGDCTPQTEGWITDPVVQIYTSNIHCNYAHSFMSQCTYFFSDAVSEKSAYESILPYIEECGAESSVKAVRAIGVTP